MKTVLFSASGAAVLAFISGLFGRVTFGAMLLRSLFWAGVFGIFSLGVYMLLQKMVPELFEERAEPESEFQDGEEKDEEISSEKGSNLNIVLEGDDPALDNVISDDDGEREEGEGLEDGNEFVEEIQAVDDESENEESAEDDGEKVSAFSSSSADRNQTDDEDVRDRGAVSDVDTLPDLEDFSDSFESVAASQDSSDHFTEKSQEGVDLLGEQHDPATVAKAVRTIIGRDQEG